MGLWETVKGVGGSVLGGLVDVGMSWLGNEIIAKPNAERAYKDSKEASALSFERSYGAYKSRYQDTMKDMKAAGLNPILAASSGFKPSSAPQAATAQAFQAQPH